MNGLDQAWDELEVLVREKHPGRGFGIRADGPGYVAWVGHEAQDISAWSVDDEEITTAAEFDHPATPEKAVRKLIERLR